MFKAACSESFKEEKCPLQCYSVTYPKYHQYKKANVIHNTTECYTEVKIHEPELHASLLLNAIINVD